MVFLCQEFFFSFYFCNSSSSWIFFCQGNLTIVTVCFSVFFFFLSSKNYVKNVNLIVLLHVNAHVVLQFGFTYFFFLVRKFIMLKVVVEFLKTKNYFILLTVGIHFIQSLLLFFFFFSALHTNKSIHTVEFMTAGKHIVLCLKKLFILFSYFSFSSFLLLVAVFISL